MSNFPKDQPAVNPYAAPTGSSLPELPASSVVPKEIKNTKTFLIVIGLFTLIVNGVLMFTIPAQVDKELQGAFPGGANDPMSRNIVLAVAYAIQGFAASLGIVFIALGFLLRKFPVPVTITAFALYVLSSVGFALLDPSSLAAGIVIKAVIVYHLFKAIKFAKIYQREKTAAANLVV